MAKNKKVTTKPKVTKSNIKKSVKAVKAVTEKPKKTVQKKFSTIYVGYEKLTPAEIKQNAIKSGCEKPNIPAKKLVSPKPSESTKTDQPIKKVYKFKNYFISETQLGGISYKSDPADILEAYARLINVYASKHFREGIELDDLIAEGQRGVCEAIEDFHKPKNRKKKYNFHQACMYKIRSCIYQYCLRNITQLKTPYYIQRGCMHIGQIFTLMNNQMVAERLLNKRGPATEEEIIEFIYNEKERLPIKPMKFIKAQILKEKNSDEFKQILSGVMNHELGSRHSYVKNNLTDIGKVLHIKQKLYYAASSNNMNYKRVIDLIFSARHSKIEYTPNLINQPYENVDVIAQRNELIKQGRLLCGEDNFNIFLENKVFDKSYDDIANTRNLKKSTVMDIIKECIKLLKKDPIFLERFLEP